MTNTEQKLKERVKELTCLYEVTSIIVNSNYDELETSLEAIAHCLKRGWQFAEAAAVQITIGDYQVQTKNYGNDMVSHSSDVKIFNKVEGRITVGYPSAEFSVTDFLDEERTLLKNVCLAIGNLMERKHIRDSEEETKRQMERADRFHIMGEITAGIAHELNTPLANILGFAELLVENTGDEATRRDLQKIIDNAIFSREIVKKLMFFTCEMPQEMEQIELNAVVENVLRLLAPSLKAKQLNIVKSFGREHIQMRANTVQLTQVLFNLIMNAAYYSPPKGAIHIELDKSNDRTIIRIADEGQGIETEHADKIFEPFYTSKPTGEGTGLGLSVVHGIVRSYKGTISHRPNTPKGTIFTLEFPKI
ncbi:sensor histidine kinase [Flagellimonas pelagia]|uniref:histidine kinase n=1 Tax=Flagellimonas pelagia TaxID=2306998 RepID=A0A3A1NHV4_9FLAO|nr:HAMP domain-containing sensor histidine kinase [Allomuricauda maritima]RIV44285.1 sensor histidine kinase [Allomuricauda maritima]RUA18043.1 MAG: sensor histidine kinase [Flavobacteriia bacterium]TXJ94200.1 HAMP domain-containing histidine kinase [Allomuricauda maritima]